MLKELSSDRWSYETAAHLLNRAGFGGTPADIGRLAALGLEGAVDSLVDYEQVPDATPNPDWARPEPERMRHFLEVNRTGTPDEKRQLQQETRRLQRQRIMELRGWWLQRMAAGPRPLQEKMTLFWHGHFATSFEKVRDAYFMWRQNDIFRRLATGNWTLLLLEAGKDPAMLVWLDQALSRRQHPNENFAREVMELFALGEGHYTERDVTEAARALTGWSLDRQAQSYIYRPFFHDSGSKTIFGQTGNFDGDDFIGLLVAQPQAARFITAKVWNYFAGSEPSPELNEALAANFRANGGNFKPLLKTLFRSQEFYSADIVRNEVKSPVQWLVGTARMLECSLPPPLISWGMTRQLGQDLFAPPNVKGWDGGVTWITTNTLLTRYNDAQALVQGTLPPLTAGDFAGQGGGNGQKAIQAAQRLRIGGVSVDKILTPEERKNNRTLIASLQNRLFQTDLKPDQQETLREFLDAKTKMSDADILTAIRLMMSTPEYQVT
ncbi:MAG TPA: DUF1800 domain-containing protein [Candidatus Acidoferrales bacterium]|nr:DUF1800 domain-containing protein [Candidatus Acidoferrales bacterium]